MPPSTPTQSVASAEPNMSVDPGPSATQTPASGSQPHSGTGRASTPLVTGKVSLANLLINFMGEPLAATGLYDDVQLIFYPFNSYAGFASRINIANFEIDLDFFTEKYTEYRLQNLSRSGNLTIREFWTFLNSNIIEDYAARSYGLSEPGSGAIYRRVSERGENRQTTTVARPIDSDQATTVNRLNQLLSTITPDGSFRLPQLNFTLECLPGRVASEGDASDSVIEKTILRVHIYDQQASSYEGLGSILRAQRNGALTVGPNPNRAGSGLDSLTAEASQRYYQQILQRANETGLVTRTEQGNYEVVGGSNAIKQFLYQTVPYIIHGSKNSLVKQANLSTMTDPAANTSNMLRAPRGGALIEPNGEDIGGLPMQILPTEVAMETFGCPLFEFSSQYFIDFNTGTTADNIYCANSIEHRISPGEFTTNIKFSPLDGYGQYRNYIAELNNAVEACNDILTSMRDNAASTSNPPPAARRRRRRRPQPTLTSEQIEDMARQRAFLNTSMSVQAPFGRPLTQADILINPQLSSLYEHNLYEARQRIRTSQEQARARAAGVERQAVQGRADTERQAADIQRQASGQIATPPVQTELTDAQIHQVDANAVPSIFQQPIPAAPTMVFDPATGRMIDSRTAQSLAAAGGSSASSQPTVAAGAPRRRS